MQMTEPTYGDYDRRNVDGMNTLVQRMHDADCIKDWSFILGDYISWGNNKISKNTGIFNLNSATDCPNADTEACQVPWDSCYAHVTENIYDATLPYRRRQEYLWDCLDADTFAKAFLKVVERKRNSVKALRLCESGDFRHRSDIIKADRIAELLQDNGFHVYTYSASGYLDWSEADNLVVNASNRAKFGDYGDRAFDAVPTIDDIPDDAVMCPFEKAKKNGVSTDERPKCGDCMLCYRKDGPDVTITLH